MSVNRISFFLSFLLGVFFFSCSTTKKGFLNREYHSLTTKYNILFNAKEAFTVGETILKEAFEEDYSSLLPIEPINLRGENFDDTTIVPGFERAEEKAVKAIQKHSIKLNEIQYNRQIEDAYLVLGKARYFDRRFFPALEAFNFLLENGASAPIFTEGKIWREKTNIRLNNFDLAIENLRPLAQNLDPTNKLFPLANASLAEAFIQLKALDSAAIYIQRAAAQEPKRKNKARYLFISGQLLELLGQQDSAQKAYARVGLLKRKAPRNLLIQAQINTVFLDTTWAPEAQINILKRLLNNYENEPYQHRILSALAKLNLEQQKDSIALDYFEKALAAPTIDRFTEMENYQTLSSYFFMQGEYVKTANYLDRLLPFFDEKSTKFKQLQRRRESLSEVITYEQIAQETDSILDLLARTPLEQQKYFQAFIEAQQEQLAKTLQAEVDQQKAQLFNKTEGTFYFYNANLVFMGKQNYLARWGNRPNSDNWRRAESLSNQTVREKTTAKVTTSQTRVLERTPEQYMQSLAQTAQSIDSITLTNYKAYLQLGLLYKEKYENFPLSKQRLESLISRQPPDELKVQALYHLFQMANVENDPSAMDYKKQLLDDFSQTPFAQLLTNSDTYEESLLATPEFLYKEVLELYQQQQFKEALAAIAPLLVLSSGSITEPKTALLKAHIIGRLEGVEAWREALKELSANYSATDEAKTATALLKDLETFDNLSEKGVIYKNYKWIFPFSSAATEQIQIFSEALKKNLQILKSQWAVSIDPFDNEYTFVVVHGIRALQEIEIIARNEGLIPLLEKNKENFVALASQYRTVLKNKNWKTLKDERIRNQRSVQ